MNENDKKRIFMMRVLVGSVALIILILWILNLKNVWRDSGNQNTASSSAWSSLKSDLQKTLNEAQTKLNKIETDKTAAEQAAGDKFLAGLLAETTKNSSAPAQAATSSPETATSSPIYYASSTPGSVGIASTTKANKNCPPYIDCMPTIGATRPCVVPAGCEGMTVIAY